MSADRAGIELILQDCLERIQSGQATLEGVLAEHPDQADELRPLLEAALWLQVRKATLDPRPGFVSASRRRVVEQIRQEQAAPAQPRWAGAIGQFWQALAGQRRLALQFGLALLVVLALVAGSAGAARAAQRSLPGDPFYGLKITLENAAVGLAWDDAERAELHIRLAQRRLDEIQALVAENRVGEISKAVELYEEHVNQAIRHMIAVRGEDQERANALAVSLQAMLEENAVIFQILAKSASEGVAQQIERLLLVSAGVVELLEEHVADIPLPAILLSTTTSVPSATPVITREVAVSTSTELPTFTQTQMPPATLAVMPTFLNTPVAELTIASTPTVTVTLVAESEEDENKPTKTPKPTKVPKPTKTEKVKDKDLPEPTRRPVDPPNDR